MRMETSLNLRPELKLTLAPQIIQSIEILQLPLLQLRQRIDQELEQNPTLEQEDPKPEDLDPGQSEPEDEEYEEEIDKIVDNLVDASDDWRDSFSHSGARRAADPDKDGKLEALMNTPERTISLQDYLLSQLNLLDIPSHIRETAENIISNIDDDGRLPCSLEEIIQSMDTPVSLKDGQEALKIVQGLEPLGVGARDLVECLMLQLNEDEPYYELKATLIQKHLEDIYANRLPSIAKETGYSVEEIKDAIEYIGNNLNPKPGAMFGNDNVPYVAPDVVVEQRDGRYEIVLEDENLPRLYVSPTYRHLLKNKDDPETRNYVKKQFESARWLIDAIAQRHATLYKVASKIVEMQKDFLDKGVSHLKPLKMQDVADEIGMHVSTVSRAISGKYIQTPQGIHEMKFFFTGGTQAADGKMESYDAVKEKIKEIVEAEDKSKPLSDEDIAKKLRGEGLDIARRTVTKYREILGIPSSRQRKDWVKG